MSLQKIGSLTLLKRFLFDILTLGVNKGDSITGTCCRDVLKQAEIPIVGVTKCNSTRYTDGQIFNTNICAGFDKGGVDSCQVISDVVTRDPLFSLRVGSTELGRRLYPDPHMCVLLVTIYINLSPLHQRIKKNINFREK